MKKAGSLNSKSKTPRTSKTSAKAKPARAPAPEAAPRFGEVPPLKPPSDLLTPASLAEVMSVGHAPPNQLNPHDAALFRSFQSNLLSLISHELRTPLMGILNSLGLLEDDGASDSSIPAAELISMARQNAQRLQRTLASLLDLASINSGGFHAQLREVDLVRLARNRVSVHRIMLLDHHLQTAEETEPGSGAALLADPKKLARAIDLCFEAAIPRAEPRSRLVMRVSSNEVEISFHLTPGLEGLWEDSWAQALAGHEGGVGSPGSAFAGVLQSEEAFLTRKEEGLGSEFMLVHQIMKLHAGVFEMEQSAREVTMRLKFVELSSGEGLQAVLASRAYGVSHELGSVALVLVQVASDQDPLDLCRQIKRNLFRASDAVYALPERHQVALVLDDCKSEDAPKLVERVAKKLDHATTLHYGMAHCPSDVLDPAQLLKVAEARLARG